VVASHELRHHSLFLEYFGPEASTTCPPADETLRGSWCRDKALVTVDPGLHRALQTHANAIQRRD